MKSLNKENMKFVSGAGNESILGADSPLVLVIVTKPEQLGQIQDFFKQKGDMQQTPLAGNPEASNDQPANTPVEQPSTPQVAAMFA